MIVSLGDVALDVYVRPETEARWGSDVPGTVRLLPGGSAANVAVWAARLGAASTFIGAVGDDPAGAVLRTDLEREGVTACLRELPAPTATIAVLIGADGERAMIPDRGAATLLTPELIDPAWLPPGCRLHLPAYSLVEEPLAGAALHAATLCRAGDGQLGVDASSVEPLRRYGRERFLALLEMLGPELLFANAAEAAFLSGQHDPEAGSALLQRYAPVVLWKLGAAGALARGETLVRVAGLPAPVVDTTGAGDAFAAAFTVAYSRGAPLQEALGLANRLAAKVVQELGARPPLRAPGADP